MAFAFKITSEHRCLEEVEHLVRSYNPGRSSIRVKTGRYFVYYVYVHEPTKYGVELADWLRRGAEYDRQRKINPNFPDSLRGPVWATELKDGTILHRYWLKAVRY